MRGKIVFMIVSGILALALAMPAWAGVADPGLPPGDDPWPPSSVARSPAMHNTPIVKIDFFAEDEGTGVAEVHLWAACGTGAWHDTGLVAEGSEGTFEYKIECAQGVYYFATVALDNAGNWEDLPMGSGDSQTIVDLTPPASSATSPEYVQGTAIPVAFSITGNQLTPVKEVHLWAACTLGIWHDTGLVIYPTDPSNEPLQFLYRATCGSGFYYFATVAADMAGNWEEIPIGNGDTRTYLNYASPDNNQDPLPGPSPVPPESVASSPRIALGGPIPVSFTYWGGAGGVVEVHLWVRKPNQPVWQHSGMVYRPEDGNKQIFFYQPTDGNGMYCFATVAVDMLGNREPLPGGQGDTQTFLDAVIRPSPDRLRTSR